MLLQNNEATNGDGGAVSNWTVFSADGSTFANNLASGQGGAIFNGVRSLGDPGDQPFVNLLNNTISGNEAESGGGVANFGRYWIRHQTIAENHARSSGGGILMSSNPPSGVNVLYNSIIATNTSGGSGANCSGPAGFDGGNLEDLDTCGLAKTSDKPNTDPMLGPLQNNGGLSTSMTHLPADTSPVIDAAILPPSGAPTPNDCPVIDQRGVNRPQSAACDIGSVEVESPAATATPEIACQAELTFADASYSTIAHREGQADTLVILDVPAEMEQEIYPATINGQSFECGLSPDFPEQLFCVGPRVTEGAQAEMEVFAEGCSQPVFKAKFSVPFPLYPTPTPTPTPSPTPDVTKIPE